MARLHGEVAQLTSADKPQGSSSGSAQQQTGVTRSGSGSPCKTGPRAGQRARGDEKVDPSLDLFNSYVASAQRQVREETGRRVRAEAEVDALRGQLARMGLSRQDWRGLPGPRHEKQMPV